MCAPMWFYVVHTFSETQSSILKGLTDSSLDPPCFPPSHSGWWHTGCHDTRLFCLPFDLFKGCCGQSGITCEGQIEGRRGGGGCISSVKKIGSKEFLYTSALYWAEGGEPPRGSQWNKDTCAHADMAALCKGKWTRLELPGGGELLCSLCSRAAKAVWLLLLKLYLSNRSRRLSSPSWCIALSTLRNACVHRDCFQMDQKI